jgi:hypothetical protein
MEDLNGEEEGEERHRSDAISRKGWTTASQDDEQERSDGYRQCSNQRNY